MPRPGVRKDLVSPAFECYFDVSAWWQQLSPDVCLTSSSALRITLGPNATSLFFGEP